MKFVLMIVSFFATSTTLAASLDDLWGSQLQQIVQPVQANGISLRGTKINATYVCTSIGFSRLVSFDVEPCLLKTEKLVDLTETPSVAVNSPFLLCSEDLYSKKLKSVTCAR